jgi:hypothetical protein
VPVFNAQADDLELDGPVIEVSLLPVQLAREAMVADGGTIPPPVKARALIDTGAQGSAVKEGLLAGMGLHPVGVTPVVTPTDHDKLCPVYTVDLALSPVSRVDINVIEVELHGESIDMLLGRDVLRDALFFYQGPSHQFTLSL